MIETHFIARLSGLPTNQVADQIDLDLVEVVQELLDLDEQLNAITGAACDALYSAIGRQYVKSIRYKLVEARRTLFVGRRPKPPLWQAAFEASNDDERRALCELELGFNRLSCLEEEFAGKYSKAAEESQRRFRVGIAAPAFLRALALSSPTLFINALRYQAGIERGSRSRLLQVERGIARYYTRAAMKATPFATFCSVVTGRLRNVENEVSSPVLAIEGNPAIQRSAIRLNKRIYGLLWPYLKSIRAVRDRLGIEANQTLKKEPGEWRYLATAGDRETFQKVKSSSALDKIVDVVRGRELTLGELVKAIASEPTVDATEEEARAYLDTLVNAGFLNLRAVVGHQEPEWDAPLLQLIESIEDPRVQRAAQLLKTLREVSIKYLIGDTTEAAAALKEMRDSIEGTFKELRLPLPIDLDLPLYEDATADASVDLTVGPQLRRAFATLDEFVEITEALAYPRPLQASMRSFFDSAFASSVSVPLLEFFERFYREHFKEHRALEARRRQDPKAAEGYDFYNPFRLQIVDAIRAAQARITRLFYNAWLAEPDAEEVVVSRETFLEATSEVPRNPNRVRSSAIFCQIKGADRIVVPIGDHRVGYGKFYSRFLHLLPDSFTATIQSANEGFTTGVVAEILGDSHFNGNLHPSLLPSEIAYPTSDAIYDAQKLSVNELFVMRDGSDSYSLRLVRTEGTQVYPVDLGFLNPIRRPPLFHLLSGFMPAGAYILALPDQLKVSGSRPSSTATEVASEITYRPRMVYADSIVVARRRWSVPSNCFPDLRDGEREDSYFLRLHRWRKQYGIPSRFFVRVKVTPGRPPEQASPAPPDATGETVPALPQTSEGDDRKKESPAKRSRDWLKPQYIDLRNPILVRLFCRIPPSDVPFVAYLEECYPDYDDLPSAGEHRFSYELVLQSAGDTANDRAVAPQ